MEDASRTHITVHNEEVTPLLGDAGVDTDGHDGTSCGEIKKSSDKDNIGNVSIAQPSVAPYQAPSGNYHRVAIPSSEEDTFENECDVVRVSHGVERDNQHAISNCDTIIHLLKGNIGTGILAMPDAIKNSGLIFGSVGLVILSVFCVSCMHMLVHCAQTLVERTRKPFMTYSDVAEHAFLTSTSPFIQQMSSIARMTVNVFLCITQLGFCCVYFVFVAQNMKLVFDHHFGIVDYHLYMLMILLPMLILCSVRNLKYLAPVSMLANLFQFLGLGLVFFYLLQDLPPSWSRKGFATWEQLPLYFGTAIYAFEGIGVVLPLENQMRYPNDLRGWNGVLNTSMMMVTCLYIAVGFFGYLKYGDEVEGAITLNLPVEQWLAQIVILMMSLAIFFSYGLQFYVPIEMLLPKLRSKVPERHHLLAEFGLRYFLVLLTFCLAAAIPRLDLFISLVGAVSSSTLALMAPTILHTVVYWETLSGCKGRLTIGRNLFLFLVGFVGFVAGTYVSVSNIITYFATGV